MAAFRDQALVDLVDARAQMVFDLADDDLENAGLLDSEEETGALLPLERRHLHRVALLTVGVLAFISLSSAVALAVTRYPMRNRPARAQVADSQEKFAGAVGAALSILTASSHGMQLFGAIGYGMEDVEKIVYDSENISKHHDLEALINATHELSHLHGTELEGANKLHDGNACPDNEEQFGGLCYQKCGNLTQGTHPIRTTAFSCCAQQPCNAFNSVFTNPVKFCQGLDVGGRQPGFGCPHLPGDCLLNEEFHLGSCYKKCTLFTDAEYPYRTSADTCCKLMSYMDCLAARNVMTNATFDIGGGEGDKVFASEAGQVHAPLLELAEAQPTTTLYAVSA